MKHSQQNRTSTDDSHGVRNGVPPSEEGYMLLTAVFLLVLLVVSLSIALPSVIKSIQRDRDVETWHRGMQYRRAVQVYYRKFHAYPPNADALVKTNNIRFLRKKYNDPVTGKDDWKPVMFGQNKTPTAMGFFGQPLSGNASTIAGIGPSGGNGLGANGGMTGSSAFGSSSSFGSSSFGSSSSSGSSSSFGSSLGGGSIFGSSDSGSSSNTPGSSSGASDGSGGTGSSGTPGASGSPTGSSSSSNSGFGAGQTFGGAGIIGFSPGSDKQSILVYKKKNHYNEWEFTYDPISEMKQMGGGNTGGIGQPASSTSNPVGSPPFGNSGFGGSGTTGFGSGNSGFGGTNSGSSPFNTSPQSPSMPPEGPAPQ
jgi:type II secretory pathway pseudopilin PulG